MRRNISLVFALGLSGALACELVTEPDYGLLPPCSSEHTLCDGMCWDLRVSQQHCGACGNSCQYYGVCNNGVCGCPGGMSLCGQSCVNTLMDNQNCGSCGHFCNSGFQCQAGACVQACLWYCYGKCVDPNSDPLHCGACGNACDGGKCVFGKCVDESDAGDADTDADPDAGDADTDAGGDADPDAGDGDAEAGSNDASADANSD